MYPEGLAERSEASMLYCTYMGKMSSEMMAYSCSPWKTDLGSTLLRHGYFYLRCLISHPFCHIMVTSSIRLFSVGPAGARDVAAQIPL